MGLSLTDSKLCLYSSSTQLVKLPFKYIFNTYQSSIFFYIMLELLKIYNIQFSLSGIILINIRVR